MYLTDSLQGIDRHLMIAAEEINFPSNSDRSITYTYLLKIQLQRQAALLYLQFELFNFQSTHNN